MKTVIIPSTENPWSCEINGIKYTYPAGTEQSVPDEVADLIGDINEIQPREDAPGEVGQVWTNFGSDAAWADIPVTDISGKQDKLVSGTNIKTVNGNSLLGSGNVTIAQTEATVVQVTGTSTTDVMSQKACTDELNLRSDLNGTVKNSIAVTLTDNLHLNDEGTIVTNSSSGRSVTNAISLIGLKSISVNFTKSNIYLPPVVFYNSNDTIKQNVVSIITSVTNGNVITVPTGATYARVQVEVTLKDSFALTGITTFTYPLEEKVSKINGSNEIGVFFGDSLMYGVGVVPYDGSVPYWNAPTYAQDILYSKIYNAGYGGSTLSRASSANGNNFCELVDAICEVTDWSAIDARIAQAITTDARYAGYNTTISELKSLDFSTVDFILVAYGTNDWTESRAMGDTTSTSQQEFVGALRYCVNTLLTHYPKLKIYVATPSQRFDALVDGNSDTKTFLGKNLREYSEGIVNASNMLNLPCKNIYIEGMINAYNKDTLLSDGVHRNKDGYKLLGSQYAKFIMSN